LVLAPNLRYSRQVRAFIVLLLPLLSTAQTASFGEWKLVRTIALHGPTHHVQGIDFEGSALWLTSVDRNGRKGFLQTFDLESGALRKTFEIQDNERFHPGGITLDGSVLWAPVAEYRAKSSSVIQRRNKRTLELEYQFPVNDHIGCIAATPEFLIGGNWDSREFYVWNRQGKLLRTIPNANQNAYQDMKFADPYVVASGLLAGKTGAIDWLELPSLALSRRIPVGNTDRGVPFTREAMSIHGDQLILAPEDDPSRVFLFRREH